MKRVIRIAAALLSVLTVLGCSNTTQVVCGDYLWHGFVLTSSGINTEITVCQLAPEPEVTPAP